MNAVRRWAAGFLPLLLAACSTLPATIPAGGPFPGLYAKSDLPAAEAPGIPALEGRWLPLDPGGTISAMAGKIKNPRLEFWALRIELTGGPPHSPAEDPVKNPRPRIVLGAGEGGFPRPGYVLSTRVSSFVRNRGLLAGINTVPFDPSSAREGEERRLAGVAVIDGKIIAPPAPRYDALVFYAEGGAAIVNQGELAGETAGILQAAGGFHRILRDGELTERSRHKAAGPRFARSAAGLSAGGGVLYLMVIDGGLPGRRGATEAEAALILQRLGADAALNLDGGGSSSLALRFSGGRVETLNSPRFPRRERAVALCLGIALD